MTLELNKIATCIKAAILHYPKSQTNLFILKLTSDQISKLVNKKCRFRACYCTEIYDK